jgi:hypothetical protein
MISVNQVYVAVQNVLNKSQRGYLKPSDFNAFANISMYQMYEDIKISVSDGASAIIKGKADHKSIEQADDALNGFFKTDTLTPIGNVYSKPSDFDFFGVTGGLFIDDIEITKVTLHESKLLKNISYMNPSNSTPVYIEYENGYEVISFDIDSDISIYYNRYFKTPIWTYQVINGDIVYDASSPNLQNFELPLYYFNQIVEKILFLAGLNIRDNELLSNMVQKENAEELIDYRNKTLM